MTAPWAERNGGLWLNRAGTSDKLIAEQYHSEQDVYTLIWQRASDGLFQAEYLVKGKAQTDPQWSLPFWGNIADQGIFGTIGDAQLHLQAIADQHQQRTPMSRRNEP
jgi:hypothetical protein